MDLCFNLVIVFVLYVHVNSALPERGMMITRDWEGKRKGKRGRLLDLVSMC